MKLVLTGEESRRNVCSPSTLHRTLALGCYNAADLLVLKESITERILYEASCKYQ